MELTDTYTYNIFKVLKYNDFLSSAPHKTYLGLTLSYREPKVNCMHVVHIIWGFVICNEWLGL